jgi:glycosyltransferase involved in cell wall biosynthesis
VAPERIADAWERVIAEAIQSVAPVQRDADELPCVVITGPVSNAISGISTHVGLLTSALKDRWTLLHFPIGGEGLQESFAARGLRLIVAPLRLAQLLRRRRPALVHVNTSLSTRACIRDALVVATCLLCAQPFVLQFHGGHPPGSATRMGRIARRTLGRVLRLAERVVAISREDEIFYRAAASTTRVVRIPNGVAMKGLPAERFRAGRLRLLHFGRLAEDKGLLDILDALALLKERELLSRLSLVVAGTGPLLAAARRRVGQQGLEGAVRFVGAAFGAQKDELIADADLFVFPTHHAERVPYALLESMSAGVVPVTCSVGAIADVVTDGRQGFLVKPRDPRGLADLLAALLRDRSALPALAAASRESIRASYSLERMANAFSTLYAEVSPSARLDQDRQIGASIDLASGVKSFGPASDMYQQSSMRTPNSPGM